MSPGQHAERLVVGVILVSLCFALLPVVDVAVSGPWHHGAPDPARVQDAVLTDVASARAMPVTERSAPDDGCAMHAVFVQVPTASAEAIDL